MIINFAPAQTVMVVLSGNASLHRSPVLQLLPFSSHLALSMGLSDFCFCSQQVSQNSPTKRMQGVVLKNEIIPASLWVQSLFILKCPPQGDCLICFMQYCPTAALEKPLICQSMTEVPAYVHTKR